MTDSPRLLDGGDIATVEIQENDNSRGVVNVAFTSATVSEEPGSAVSLELVRTRGVFGAVSVNYVVRAGTASLEDVSEATASGTVQFMSGQQRAMFEIDIFNDAIPELDEEFTVELVSATDGVELGDSLTISVTILANDDINGVFFFSNTSLLVSLYEYYGVISNSGLSDPRMDVELYTSLQRTQAEVPKIVLPIVSMH